MPEAPTIPTPSPTARRPVRAPARTTLDRERLLGIAAIAVPCAIATLLAFYDITARSLWLDEAASVAITSQHGVGLWHAMEHDGGNMLGYYTLLHLVVEQFGQGALAIRFASALATGATVALVALLARRVFDWRVALAAGLLAAVSVPLVYWGQNARSYALMITFVTASFLAFLAVVDQRPGAPPARWAWLAYVMSTLLAAYMSFEALLIVPAQLAPLLWTQRRSLRAVLPAVATVGVGCVPLLVLAYRRGSSQLFWVPRPNLTQLHQTLEALLSAGLQPNFHLTPTGTALLVLTGALVLAAGAAIAHRASWPEQVVLCWLIVPVALSVLESFVVQPIDLSRAALVSLPAASIVLARGTMDHRVPRLLGIGTICVVLALRALQLAPTYGASPENWRAATAHVLASARRGDCIAFYPSDGRQAFSYYLGRGAAAAARAPRSVLPAQVPWSELRSFVEDYRSLSASALRRAKATCPRLWFVSSHHGLSNGPPASRTDYARYRALLGSLTRVYGRGRTAIYGWASPVRVELFTR